jgi:predicted MPP superfamily phosphohydrolase
MGNPGGGVRWLHLSDFHFVGDQKWERRQALAALLRWAKEQKEKGEGPDLVFLTGDIANHGKAAEYQQALEFFRKLGEALELDPRERFYVIPGNHDVDRAAITRPELFITNGLATPEDVEAVFADAATMSMLSRRLDAFYNFTEDLQGKARAWQPARPWRVDVPEVNGIKIGVLQLNSAWCCGPGEVPGKLWVGMPQVVEALELVADAAIKVALVHHPPAELHPGDIDSSRRLTSPAGPHFLLRGHLHDQDPVARHNPDGVVFELAVGAIFTDDKQYPRTFQQMAFDPVAGRATITFHRYSPSSDGFWAPDPGAFYGAKEGQWTFELPPSLRGSGKPLAAPLTSTRAGVLAHRYRDAVVACFGSVKFIGFAEGRPRRNVPVPDLFVPLRLASDSREGKSDGWTTTRLLNTLAARTDPPARMVILGGPGSGKTTLCLFALCAFAGQVEGIFEEPPATLPLYLPLRDYVRRGAEQPALSFVDYLQEQASGQLQLALPPNFLIHALESGEAVLLLDGLDEVGSAAERVDLRGKVQAFCRLYPALAVLVTSRIQGYDEAPLSLDGRDAFRQLWLEDFNDDDLTHFVRQWYGAQEPNDPVAREQGMRSLQLALDATPGARALARSPLLATLIALVHRFEAHLPGERVKLYDLCVKTLLETWPESRKKTFYEIDAGLQRSYLEELAWRMQSERGYFSSAVTIEENELIAKLAEIVSAGQGIESAIASRPVTRWVRFLREGTGVLIEQQPGIYAFLHLSLLEYLAACAWRRAPWALDEAIFSRYSESRWTETCLLAVGDRATDKTFLDRHFERFTAKPTPESWHFLLRCLREEAAFDESQRVRILEGCAQAVLDGYRVAEIQKIVDQLATLSRRHAEPITRWLNQELNLACGAALQAVVALFDERSDEIWETLRHRNDSAVAGDLLSFWPTPIGMWAAKMSSVPTRFRWAQETHYELAFARLLTVLWSPPARVPMASPILVALMARAANTRSLIERQFAALAEERAGRGLPSAVRTHPGRNTLSLVAGGSVLLPRGDSVQYALQYFSPFLGHYFGREGDFNCVNYFVDNSEFVEFFDPAFQRLFVDDFVQGDDGTWLQYSAQDFDRYSVQNFVGDIHRDFAHQDDPEVAVAHMSEDFLIEEINGKPATPPTQVRVREVQAWFNPRGDSPESLAQLGEIWVALISTHGIHQKARAAFCHLRLEHRLILERWVYVERDLPGDFERDPFTLSAYFALGWSQANTTLDWPETPLWRKLLGGDPPAHWLPRYFFALCWNIGEPEDVKWLEMAHACLDAGQDETGDFEGLAAALREYLVPLADFRGSQATQ